MAKILTDPLQEGGLLMSEFEGPMKRCTSRSGANLAWFLMAFRVGLVEARWPSLSSSDRANVVMSLMEGFGEMKDQDLGPSVRVHGGRYVIVHYPRYMKRAGD